MLAALILLLGFIGRASRRWAALLGGIGFGTFIDEVGKFVTRDNDYFYRPAVAMIYVVFVLAYLAIRSIQRRTRLSSDEYVINALHELEEAALRDLQREERERALHYLSRADPGDPLAQRLDVLIRGLAEAPSRASGRLERAAAGLLRQYRGLTQRPVFWRALVLFFAGQVIVKLLHVAILVTYPEAGSSLPARLAFMSRRIDDYALPEWLQLGSSLLSVAFVAAGITALRRSRQRALRLFHRSILISVFVTQVFMFYRSQWDALVVLGFNLLVLVALGYMRSHEEQDAA
jgi:Ca2+/Na+ antiporter